MVYLEDQGNLKTFLEKKKQSCCILFNQRRYARQLQFTHMPVHTLGITYICTGKVNSVPYISQYIQYRSTMCMGLGCVFLCTCLGYLDVNI